MGIETTFESLHEADSLTLTRWWMKPALRRTLLVLLALVPLLTPIVAPADDGLFIYPYCAVLQLLGAWFCWQVSHFYPKERVRWQTVAIAQCVHALPYGLAGLEHRHLIGGPTITWLANACVAECWVLFLPALMGIRAVRGKWVRMLDYALAVLTCGLLMRAMGSGVDPRNGTSRVMVIFIALCFLTLAALIARVASTRPGNKLFFSVMLLYLGSCLVVNFLINIANFWLPTPNILGSDILIALPQLFLCEAAVSWRAPVASNDADTDLVLIDSFQPSIMALGGVLAALYGFRIHPVLAAGAVLIIVVCYAMRTHLFYHRLFLQQRQLQSQAIILEDLATRDALTGVGNRRWFDEEATKLLSASRTYPCSMLLIDTDNFKDINDGFGHPIGDEVLRAIAAALSEVSAQVKRSCCARIGGDEFGALLPGTTREQALIFAEAIRLKVEHRSFQEPICATVSVGVATAQESVSLLDLIRDADDALYSAKAAGRNLVFSNED